MIAIPRMLLSLLTGWARAPLRAPPAAEAGCAGAPEIERRALVRWAEEHRFVRDAAARAWLGKVGDYPTALELGTDRASPVQIVMMVPVRVAAPVTLTAATVPRDGVERIVARLFDDPNVAPSLVSASILRGVVHLTMVPDAPPVAVELAMLHLALRLMRGPRPAGRRGALH
jgi:hypothetical protein